MVVVVVVVWWRRLWVVLCQSFLVRRLVPETLREAPSSSPAHRLGLSHLRGQGRQRLGVRARGGALVGRLQPPPFCSPRQQWRRQRKHSPSLWEPLPKGSPPHHHCLSRS